MPKRKRDTPEGGEAEEKTAAQPSLKQLRAEQKFEHGAKLLTRAFKTARGFERQKLGRRHKSAASSNNTADVTRIDAEVAALKVGCAVVHNKGWGRLLIMRCKLDSRPPSCSFILPV